ncbi:MAG: hypothetical protein H7X85_01290 [Thermoanaerobaculia bacterium]|nr:hypothetical protein [Thermoanaerobaculia bacterium]
MKSRCVEEGGRTPRAAVSILSALTLAAGLLAIAPIGCRQAETAATPPRPLPAPARADGSGYTFRPTEQQAVDGFLGRNRDLRVATDGDRRSAEEEGGPVGSLYGVYHPYFVRGDVNDDGILDFVLGFVRRDSDRETPWFSVVVFTGRDRTGRPDFGAETFLERDISLADGDLAIDRDAILITPDLSEDSTRRYRWDPARRSYIFVREGEEAPEPPSVSQT